MTERNKLAMDQQALVADKEVRISVIHVLCYVTCEHIPCM